MAIFKLKSDLPIYTQHEMDRILAIPVAQRLQSEQGFLDALYDYIYNEVILEDSLGRIVWASGVTVPQGVSGFKKGAMFIKKDASDDGVYFNAGNEVASVWGATGSPSPSASMSPSASVSPSVSASESPSASPSI